MPSLRGSQREVPHRELRYPLSGCHQLQLRGLEADLGHPADDPYRGRHGPFATDDLLGLVGQIEIVGLRQAMRDEGRLQGYHRARPFQDLRDLGAYLYAADHIPGSRGIMLPHGHSLHERPIRPPRDTERRRARYATDSTQLGLLLDGLLTLRLTG